MKKLKGVVVSLMIFTLLVGSMGVFLKDSNTTDDATTVAVTTSSYNHEPKPLGT